MFSDSFDRAVAQENDIDASSTGMSGLAAPVTYVERGDDVLAGIVGLTNIEGNQLHVADGPNASFFYLDRNFVDGAFTMADGMRVGLTVVSNDGGATEQERWVGFGVGNTLQECQTAVLDFGPDEILFGIRGSTNQAGRPGSADLFVCWSPNSGGEIQVFKNGPTERGGENYDIANIPLNGDDRLEVEMYFDDFTAGTTVTAHILWNGEIVDMTTFDWDNTDENYIGITARQNNAGYTADDLRIEAIYNDRAQNPVPANGAVDITPGPMSLQWDKGKDGTGQPNPEITKHYVYVSPSVLPDGEPNLVHPDAIAGQEVADTADPVTLAITVDYDQSIYWRVDESVNNSGPDEPNTIAGLLWSFSTIKSVPVVDVQPADTSAFPTEPASFTVDVSSLSPLTYQWYKSGDNVVDTPGDDELIPEAESDTYTIAAVGVEDEAYYYCVLNNDGGETISTPAYLTVKRQVLYWPLDGNLQDLSGEENHGVFGPDTATPTFATDVPGAVGTQSISLNGIDTTVSALLDPNQSFDTAGFTLSMWVKSTAVAQPQFTAMFNNHIGGGVGFQIDFDNNANYRYFNDVSLVMGPASTDWVHLAAVCDGETTKVYYNLDGDASLEAETADITFDHFMLGTNRNEDAYYNGLIDEVKIWNYARSFAELADDYFAMTGEAPCEMSPTMDVDGDCQVGLSDLEILVETWLNCAYYPQSACD